MKPESSLPLSQQLALLRSYWRIKPVPSPVCMIRNMFLRWGVVTTSTKPPAGGPSLVGRPRLLTQYIHSCFPYLQAVPPSATWGRAMPWWQGPTYHGFSTTTITTKLIIYQPDVAIEKPSIPAYYSKSPRIESLPDFNYPVVLCMRTTNTFAIWYFLCCVPLQMSIIVSAFLHHVQLHLDTKI
jgi:hypothetical protein